MQRHFVNAGIYVLSPAVLDLIPRDEYFDMTSLFTALLERGLPATAFSMHDYWLDIGRKDELERAKRDWGEA
jgi:NDP-sugar pyrophosphorylase family protein